jgi:hypothetical protein
MKGETSREPHFYTSGEWINRKDIPLSNWPINKQKRHHGRVTAGGTVKAKLFIKKLDALPEPVCTHCQAEISKDNVTGLCRGCWRMGRARRATQKGYTASTGTKQAGALFDRMMRERKA